LNLIISGSSPKSIHIAQSSFPGLLQKSFAVCINQEEGLYGKNMENIILCFYTVFKHIFCHVPFGGGAHLNNLFPEKQTQLSDEEQVLLHDVCCCWLWVKKQMASHFTAEVVDQHQLLFNEGCLG